MTGATGGGPAELKPNVRLVEAPALEHVVEHLEQLSVQDVMIRSTVIPDGRTVWTAVVVLSRHGSSDFALPWILAARDSEESARAAVGTFLGGLVAARLNAMQRHPRAENIDAAADRMISETVADMWDEWVDRVRPAPVFASPPPRKPRAPRKPPPPYDEADYERWSTQVREVRAGWKMTQRQIAERAELAPSQLSQIERRQWVPSVEVAQALSEVLDIEPPALTEAAATEARAATQ